jgi:thiol-disulfide isomerase/thioredoxin
MSLFKKSEMLMYTKKDFDKKLPVGMIMIGAKWCGFCQQLKPIWKQLREEAKEHTIAAVDAMKNQELIHIMGITGYPTIFIVMNNGNIKEYTGPRTVEALKKKLPKLRKKKVKK